MQKPFQTNLKGFLHHITANFLKGGRSDLLQNDVGTELRSLPEYGRQRSYPCGHKCWWPAHYETR